MPFVGILKKDNEFFGPSTEAEKEKRATPPAAGQNRAALMLSC